MTALAGDRREKITDLLSLEAQLLDERRYDEWFDLLDDDYRYLVPQVVVTDDAEAPTHDDHAYLVMDSKASMRHKLDRRASDRAWAMHPPAVEHRLVGSIRIESDSEYLMAVRSVVLVSFARVPEPLALYPAARMDRIRATDVGWRFVERTVLLSSEVPDATQLGVIY